MRPAPLVRLLLRLYPPAFRRAYGEDALRDLLRDLREARARGGAAAAATRARLLVDFALAGVLSRLDPLVEALASGLWLGWAQDLRVALRTSLRRPGFAVIAVASLTIGVGANALVFSLTDTLFLRDIPGVDAPDRVVELGVTRAGSSGFDSWSFPDFLAVRAQAPLVHAALYDFAPVSVSDDTQGERLLAMYVTSGYFETMGVSPVMGRTFSPAEDVGPGAHPVAVISHATWVDRFDADPRVLGTTVRLNRETFTVVGVAPERFRGNELAIQPAFYLPITQYRRARDDPERFFGSRNTSWGSVVGRMPPGVELAELNAALETVLQRLEVEYPQSNAGRGARAAAAGLAPAEARSAMAIVFGLIAALMLLVLAATCANVAGMLLARASAREREMAVRAALGSGRSRLVRHLVTETMVVFALGGAAGIVLAIRAISAIDLNALLPTPFPVTLELTTDWRLVLFGLTLTGVTGLVFGVIPALQVTRHDLASVLRDSGGGTSLRASRLRRVFVAGQVAVSLLLLASAGLFTRSVQHASELDPGFDTAGVFVTGLDLALEGYADPAQANVFVDRLLEALRAMPDAADATLATDLPLDGGSSSTPVWPDGRGDREDGWIQTYHARIATHYFETFGIDVLDGRSFGALDGAGTARVAIVNRTLAEMAWPDAEPVGRTIEFGLDPAAYTVIGVVADTKSDMITDPMSPQVFSLLAQDYGSEVRIAVRQSGSAQDFVPRMRRTMLEVDPALALSTTRPLALLAGLGMLPQRIAAWIASSLGMLALLLSALGLYGVVAYSVTQQTREIGVRISLGAERRQVIGRVLSGGLLLALPGIVVGAALALALGQALRSVFLYVSPLDPAAHAAVAAILLVVLLGACVIPARRAASVQPMEALRFD